AVITLSPSAVAAGCAASDANTATCPQSAVAAFEVTTLAGDDQVDLAGALVPAIVRGGDGDDVLAGGEAGDTFVWSPGDDSDSIDGGPGDDTLEFNGSDDSEAYTITADGTGFEIERDVERVLMEGRSTELLELSTLGGDDTVNTTGLVETAQLITDGDD